MKLCFLLVCIVSLVIVESGEAGEGGHLMSKRGLHFFRLRRSSHCVDMDSETLRQILLYGICPTDHGTSSSYDEK
ncbi:hypothetical protein ECG_09791 [Echinococcus granulosus]|uniref:Somatotropin hormone n=1 Tax=Echinococcus granulosus TaxID=6210 RepID=A0A068X4K4_ECHGR|nr:hypothetical protein ECG_09791 [Echinococcus granulosus]CDS24939.1 Somatotropin hormone [Echinococcus granulosus]